MSLGASPTSIRDERAAAQGKHRLVVVRSDRHIATVLPLGQLGEPSGVGGRRRWAR